MNSSPKEEDFAQKMMRMADDDAKRKGGPIFNM